MKRIMSMAIVSILVVAILAIARPKAKQITAIDLGTLPGGTISFANGINNRGQVAGRGDDASGELRPLLWKDGRITDLGTLPGGTFSDAFALNDRGQVAGQGDTASSFIHAVLWTRGRF